VALIVETFPIELQPIAQPLSRWIVPWNPGFVHAATGRLANDQQLCGNRSAQYRPGTKRQMRFTYTAGMHFLQQRF